jgi:sugar phosphate isomerase/epimerase
LALKNEVKFCIEPNPSIYNCDFITDSQQGIEFVTKTNSEGFGLHLDSAGMTLSNEDIKPALEKSIQRLCHFHISEPYLGPVGDGTVDHQTFADTLTNLNYQGWTSIEMKTQSPDSNSLPVTKALKTAIQYYRK